MNLGALGTLMLWLGLAGAALAIAAYALALLRPEVRRWLLLGRFGYAVAGLGSLGTFAILAGIVYTRQYQYLYAWEHTGNALQGWYRLAATWSAQEGSFLLWAAWTAVIGFLLLARAGKYEARVMPFYVTVLAFLCAILLKQTPFEMVQAPSAADMLAHPEWHFPPTDGRGLNPSLVNYWMTIHPPTIFFGFASLAVPFCYAIAGLIWRDYDGWMARVMPYSLLSCATLGIGLFMGGYWAYETLGWHGFWAWDPVENASFFPWLAITALVHGAVVQKSRGGMARSNTFFGLLAFWLFLVGTFLTRSGALAGKDGNGQLLSVHAFDNIGKSALSLMIAMLVCYGAGFGLWLFRLRGMPQRKAEKRPAEESLLSRDFAFFAAVTLMGVACALVTLGTTSPLIETWMHRPITSPKPSMYNMVMLPLSIVTAIVMGAAPWLAWRRTNPDKFGKQMALPWLAMLLFGFGMLFWVQGAERDLLASYDMQSTDVHETLRAWFNPALRRMAVVALTSFGFLAALSNAMLAYRVFRARPLAAGGWLAHVGIGLLMIGVIVSNTYERTVRITVEQGARPEHAFGYTFRFDTMTGKAPDARPLNPDYDRNNTVRISVSPAGKADSAVERPNTPGTFSADIKWFVHNQATAASEAEYERMRWPWIQKYAAHDLYIGLADDPGYKVHVVSLRPGGQTDIGPYHLTYVDSIVRPGQYIAANLILNTPDGKTVAAHPGKRMSPPLLPGDPPQMMDADVSVPEIRDQRATAGAIYLQSIDAGTKEAKLEISLAGYPGRWQAPLEITYKPWVNLVWWGVLIATAGTLLAMVRRATELRMNGGNGTPTGSPSEPWETAVSEPAPTAPPVFVASATRHPRRKRVET